MCTYVDEPAEAWTTKRVRARKPHCCAVCWLTIAVGVVHDRVASLDEGRWTVQRAHSDCHALTQHIQFELCKQEVYCLESGQRLREEVWEHLVEAPEDARELLRRYRRVLRARIAEGVWAGRSRRAA